MKIVNQKRIVVVIGRLCGRADSYENAGNQTENLGKKAVCLESAREMRGFASQLADAFDVPERAISHEEYLKSVE